MVVRRRVAISILQSLISNPTRRLLRKPSHAVTNRRTPHCAVARLRIKSHPYGDHRPSATISRVSASVDLGAAQHDPPAHDLAAHWRNILRRRGGSSVLDPGTLHSQK